VDNRFDLPDLGLGLGLRTKHYGHVLQQRPEVGWFEIISENFMDTGGRPLRVLDELAERYPFVLHGVSMSIGSTDPLDFTYLAKLKALADRCRAVWVSDHLCWTGVAGHNGHDLYPVPYSEESLAWIVERVRVVQDYLERPLLLENPSTYLSFRASTIPEPEYLARLADAADCALLLDVNNVYVTCRNHGLDADAWLAAVPYDRVVQIHLAGHTDKGTHCIDTHDDHVIDEVWRLYGEVMRRAGPRATMVEWDDHIPEFEVLQAEVEQAARYRSTLRAVTHA
jgi:uncharacterized protein (UPF0276 family)